MADNRDAGLDRDADNQRRFDADLSRIEAMLNGTGAVTNPFVTLARTTHVPMLITDPHIPDNPVVFANDAFCRLTGYAREEIMGQNCRFLQGPETDPAAIVQIRAAVMAEQSVEIEICNYRKDGRPFWNRLLMGPVRDAAGGLGYFFGSQVDVTLARERLASLERRNADLMAELNGRLQAQAESEARLRFATQAGRLGIWELDLQTKTLTTSRGCRENFGRDPAKPFSYAEYRSVIAPDDLAGIDLALAQSMADGSDFEVEFRIRRDNGSAGWIEVRAQIVPGADGIGTHLAGVSRDITRRKQADVHNRALFDLGTKLLQHDDPAELAYAASEVLGRTLNVARVGHGTVDVASETITIARDWTETGLRSLAGVLHFRDYGSYVDDLKRGETVVVSDAETDARTRAGTLTTIDARSFINMPLTEQDGLVALLYITHSTAREWAPDELALIREVAVRTWMAVQRRRAEHELRALAASLEAQVAARTNELMEAEASLRQLHKMEAVGQLTGGLAHDFNNLLTGISGSLELIKTRVSQGRLGDVDRYLNAAQASARRAASLTHRMLAFSRRQTLSPVPTDVNRLVGGMDSLVRRTMGLTIVAEILGAAGLWDALVDPSQLESAILNLCINARDAMPDGGRLTIETANESLDERHATMHGLPPGQYVSVRVSDTGAGMTQDVIAKAFDPFFTTKPLGQGTGLGLSMIYGFTRQSGGHTRIHSVVDRGTMVCLYLPRHLGDGAAKDHPGQ